jgi:hypothetical protein
MTTLIVARTQADARGSEGVVITPRTRTRVRGMSVDRLVFMPSALGLSSAWRGHLAELIAPAVLTQPPARCKVLMAELERFASDTKPPISETS